MNDATQRRTTAHSSKTGREQVEVSGAATRASVKTVAKDSVQYWKPKLRKQRWGSRAAGTYQELASFYVRISHRGRKHAFTFKTVSGGAKAVGKRRFENPFSLCRVSAKEGTGSGGW